MADHKTLAAALAAFQAEEWRAIPDAPGYEASSLGRIRSVDRTVTCHDGREMKLNGRVLAPQLHKDGYLRVSIGKSDKRLLHPLVLAAFVGPRPANAEACHGNGVRTDNRIENLRWDTHSANIRDMLRHGTHPTKSRTHCPRSHALVEPNLITSILPGRGCLACNRARARVRWETSRGRAADHVYWAEFYYAEIMKEAVA